MDSHKAANAATRMGEVLASYAGACSGGLTRSFAFITSPDMKAVSSANYLELTQRAFPGKSFKSTSFWQAKHPGSSAVRCSDEDAAAIAAQ